MAYWLLKTEPDEYSYSDLIHDGHTVWDGVTNNWALKFIREVQMSDQAMIYHTGKQRCIAGIADIVSDPYPDPNSDDQKYLVFNIKPVKKMSGQITLTVLKQNSFFSDFLLVKFSRLSVIPVEPRYWAKLLELDGLAANELP